MKIGLKAFALALSLVLCALCMWPALSGPFIFDDFPNLENMRHLNAGVTRESLGQYLGSVKGNPGRPLAMVSFLIEDASWPTYPADYKRNNLLLHLLVGLLILLFTLRLTSLISIPNSSRFWAAILCATAWMISPIQLSSTMLVVQRMNILSTLFVLCGLLAYLTCLEQEGRRAMGRVLLAGLALSMFGGLALLCKENGVLIFAYAGALNYTLLRNRIACLPTLARACLQIGVAAPIVLLVVLAVFNWQSIVETYQIRSFTLYERMITQPRILLDYLSNIFLPRIGGQGLLHDDYPFSRGLLDPPITIMAILAWSAALIAAVKWRKRAPLASFAVFWFLGGHLIESTVVALELYFEHRNYLPMVGPLFALAVLAVRQNGEKLKLAMVGVACWLAANAALTRINAATWGDRGLQAQVWLSEHPNSQRAVQMAAAYYLESGDFGLARRTIEDGISQIPNAEDLQLQSLLLDCFDKTVGLNQVNWAKAVDVAGKSRYSHLHGTIVGSLVLQLLGDACHGTLTREMTFQFGEALLGNPNFQQHPESLAHVHYELARIHAVNGELDPLIDRLDLAYAFNPFPSIPREQAIYLLSAGLPNEALDYIEKSNQTPLPWIKRILLNVPSANESLERSAREMLEKHNDSAANGSS